MPNKGSIDEYLLSLQWLQTATNRLLQVESKLAQHPMIKQCRDKYGWDTQSFQDDPESSKGLSQLEANAYLQAIASCLVYEPFVVPIVHHLRPFMLDLLVHLLKPSAPIYIISSANEIDIQFARCCDISHAKELIITALSNVLRLLPNTLPIVLQSCKSSSDFLDFLSFSQADNGAEKDTRQRQLCILQTLYRLLCMYPLEFRSCWNFSILMRFCFHSDCRLRWLAARSTAIVLNMSNQARNQFLKSLKVDEKILAAQAVTTIAQNECVVLEMLESTRASLEEFERATRYEEAFVTLLEDGYLDKLFTKVFSKSDQIVPIRPHESLHNIFGVLFQDRYSLALQYLKNEDASRIHQSIIMTRSTKKNIQSLAIAIQSRQPILLTGPSGSGKTAVIREVARLSGNRNNLLEIHLDDQTDTKTLFGSYVCADIQGEFIWQPGAITTAARQGKWILIEDVDRAPFELLAALDPLLESGEMEIPGRGGESIRAHADFQFIATIGGHHNKKRWQLSAWAVIDMDILSQDEYIEILEASYSTIPSFLIDRIMKTFRVVTCESNEDNSMHFWKMARRDYGRIFSLRDLLKWCNRICTFSCTKAMDGSNASGNKFVTEDDRFRILVEAIDVFCAGIRDPSTRIQAACNLASLWDIEHSRVQHHVSEQKPAISSDEYSIKIGRVNLKMQTLRPDNILMPSSGTRLVMTKHTLRFLEKISAAVDIGEPVLLIGETGCGKTAMIQHLAVSLNQPLVVQNLNIQSESSDLIGGYKPVELALIVRPLYLQFVDLFTSTFSQKSNAAYLSLVHDAWKQKDWEKFVRGLRKAIVMARKSLTTKQTAGQSHDTQIVKKQKCTLSHAEPLLLAWNTFQLDLDRFKRQKDQIESHFAFQFVEGVLVQALRHGHWILLDEINLASAETLERISTLLESDQSAFSIVERGDVECIKPHPNFRIFGSMNPSTDVGKRDLPPSLRHRFTEIYVDECLSSQDLEQVVERTLTFQCTGKDNQSISQTIVSFYLETKQLADTKLSDGANQKPHYSLRTLCRALYIANILVQRGYGIPRTLYEAFSSTFCTLLDHDSRTLIDRKIRSTFARQLKPKELSRAPPRPGGRQAEQQYVLVQSYWIPKASYCEPNDWSISDPMTNQKQFVLTKTVEANLCHIARAAMIGKFPVLLQGPTSAGKTSLIMYLAQRIGQKCIRINNHEHTDLQEYLGAYVSDPKTGKLVFREGGLVQAVRNGWWIILDELNLAPTDVLEALNRLLDDHRELFITETQEVIRPNDRFLLFATQNPPGLYGGRKILSKAFRNRFLEIQMEEVPPKELKEILCQRCAIPPSFCSLLIEIMQVLQYRRQQSHLFAGKSGYITTRDLLRWAERRPLTKLQLAEQGYCLLAERLRKDEEKAVIRQVLEEKCNVHLDIDALYDGQQSREEYDHGVVNEDGEIERETVWGTAAHFQSVQEMIHSGEHSAAAGLQQISVTKSLRRLFSLVGRCLQHGEPVLLVGETGSGKTTVCQLYALLLQQPLYLLNCHQNTETSDIVGCFRPNRKKEDLTIKLKTSLQLLVGRLQEHNIKISSGFEQTALEELEMKGDTKLDDVINLYHKLKPKLLPITDDSFEALIASIDALVQRYGSIFEWYDGPLVKSMKEGGILLLDEVNLAQDAVLERLNSVLEPTRTLLLSEKGDSVEEVKAHPKWRILATMNPGGDFGKRELSPALRNRFTEIWVPSAANLNEFEVFVHDRLVHFPKRLQLEPLCGPVLSFIEYFNHLGRVGGRESVSITLRDVLTWIHFVQEVTNEGDIRRSNVDKWVAFVQGAALAILDGLGLGLDQPPQIIKRIRDEAYKKLLEIIPPNESSGRQQALLSLQITENIASSDLISALSASDELSTDEKLFGISPFFIPRNEHCQKSIMFSVRSPATYSNLFRVLRGLQVRRPILLEGSPGVGKSSLIHALAQASGHQLVRINLCEQTDISDLFGSDLPAPSGGDESNQDSFAGAFEWSDGVFLRALKAGGWILLDELNLASQSVLEGLNACLDHRGTVYIPELDKSFTCSPNFRIFGAQNPLRQGGGRKGLPKSFLNRFTRVVVECLEESDLLFISESLYPELQELTVDRKDGSKAGLLTLLVQFTMAIHNDTMVFHSYGRQGAPWEFNLRDILRLCELIKEHISRVPDGGSLQSFQESAMYYANLVYISRFRLHSDRDRARARLAEILPQLDSTWLKASPVALHLSPTELRVGRAVLPRRDTLNLQSARSIPPVSLQLLWRPMEALIHCVNQEWPALLVGSPASGKSCSVRLLASLTGHKVHEITLSAGFDASELLGCFEQVDLKRLVHSLHQKIVVVCEGFLPSLMVLLSEERSAGHCERLCETIADTTKLWSGLTRVYKEDPKKMLGIDAGRAASSQTESSTQQMHQIAELLDLLSPFNDRVNLQALRSEYSQLSQMLKNNAGASNAGQFEWLDGTLLQAIECGDWVLLENVNFCPASVLDRLNALLEPNGELVVNECGLVRGQLRIIRPHPDFRIFLSMDAQHGEISRAMRNRCMEIALIPLAYTPSVDGKECTRIVDCKHIVSACGVVSEVLLEGLVAIHSKILEMQHSSINRHNTRTSFSVNFSDINDRNLANWAQLLQNERARMVSTRSALTRSFERAYGRELLQIPGIASALASISTESSNKLQRGEEIQLVRMPFEAMTAPSASLSSVYAVGQDCEQWTLERHFWQLNLLLSSQVSHHNSYEGELSWPDCLAAPEISTSPFVLLQAQKHLYPARVFEKLSHRQALSPFSVLRIISSLQFDLYKRKPSALADQLLFIYHKFLRCKWKASADLTWIKVVGRFLHECLNTKSVYRRLSSKFGSLTCQPKQQMLDLLLRFEWYRFCENETYEAVDLAVQAILKASSTHAQKRDDSQRSSKRARVEQESSWTVLQHIYLLHHPQAREIASNGGNDVKYRSLQVLTMQFRENPEEFKLFSTLYTLLRGIEQVMASLALELPNIEQLESLLWKKSVFISILDSIPASCKAQTFDWTHFLIFWSWMYKTWRPVLLKCTSFRPLLNQFEDVQSRLDTILGSKSRKMTLWKYGGHALLPPKVEDWVAWNTLQHIANEYFSLEHRLEALQCGQKAEPNVLNIWTLIYDSLASVNQRTSESQNSMVRVHPILFTDSSTREELLHAFCEFNYLRNGEKPQSQQNKVMEFPAVLLEKLTRQCDYVTKWLHDRVFYLNERRGFSGDAYGDTDEDVEGAILVSLKTDQDPRSGVPLGRPILLFDHTQSDPIATRIKQAIVDVQLSALHESNALRLELLTIVSVLCILNAFDLEDKHLDLVEEMVSPLLQTLKECVKALLRLQTRSPASIFIYQDLIWQGRALQATYSEELLHHFVARLRQYLTTILADTHRFLRISSSQNPEVLSLLVHSSRNEKSKEVPSVGTLPSLQHKKMQGFPQVFRNADGAELLRQLECCVKTSTSSASSGSALIESYYLVSRMEGLKDYLFDLPELETPNTEQLAYQYGKELLINTVLAFFQAVPSDKMNLYGQIRSQLKAFREAHSTFQPQTLTDLLLEWNNCCLNTHVRSLILPLLSECNQKNTSELSIGRIFAYLGLLRLKLLSPSVPVDPLAKAVMKKEALLERLAVHTFQHAADQGAIDSGLVDHQLLCPKNAPMVTYKAVEKLKLVATVRFQGKGSVAHAVPGNRFTELFWDVQQLQKTLLSMERIHAILTTASNLHQGLSMSPSSILECQQLLDEVDGMDKTVDSVVVQWRHNYGPSFYDILDPILGAIHLIKEGIALVASSILYKMQNGHDLRTMKRQLVQSLSQTSIPIIPYKYEKQTSYLLKVMPQERSQLGVLFGEADVDLMLMEHTLYWLLRSFKSGQKAYLNDARVVFDGFLKLWQLRKDEAEAKEKEENALLKYKLRTTEITSDEAVEEAEFRKEYPDYISLDFGTNDLTGKQEMASESTSNSTLDLARIEILSFYHEQLYGERIDPQCHLDRDSVMRAFALMHKVRHVVGNMPRHQRMDTEIAHLSYLTTIHIQSELKASNQKSDGKAFQHDSNVNEMMRVASPLLQLISKLQSLLRQWPEHAILQQLVTTAIQILHFGIDSPLGRTSSAVQLLLRKAQEWEAYAASQVSIKEELKSLTQIVARWRQLELHAWPHLLELREHKFRSAAKQTWPHLYSILTGNSEMHTECDADMQKYRSLDIPPWCDWVLTSLSTEEDTDQWLCNLFDALDAYLRTSSLGQFQERLTLLHSFYGQLHTEMSSLSFDQGRQTYWLHAWKVKNILYHLRRYYNQHWPFVKREWDRMKAPIQRKLVDFCKLCRWDEQTYYSLQESADKSHRKLLKLCREYEDEVLACPMQSLLDRAMDGQVSQADGFIAIDVTRKELQDAHDLELFTEEDEAPILHLSAATSPSNQMTDISNTFVSQCRYLSQLAKLTRKVVKYTQRDIMSFKHVLLRQNVHYVCESLCASIFDRLQKFKEAASAMANKTSGDAEEPRSYKLPKGAKKKALLDLLSELKAQGFRHLMAQLPSQLQWMLHIFALEAPKINHLELDLSEAKSLNTLTSKLAKGDSIFEPLKWNWDRAEIYYYRLVEQVTALRFRVSKAYSSDLSTHEVIQLRGYSENMLHVCLQQRQVLLQTTRRHVKMVEFLDRFQALKSWCEVHLETDGEDLFVVKEWFARQKETILHLQHPLRELGATISLAIATSQHVCETKESIKSLLEKAFTLSKTLAANVSAEFPPSRNILIENARGIDELLSSLRKLRQLTTRERVIPSFGYGELISYLEEMNKQQSIYAGKSASFKMVTEEDSSNHTIQPFIKASDSVLETILLAVQALKEIESATQSDGIISRMQRLGHNISQTRIGDILEHLNTLETMLMSMYNKVTENHSSNLSRNALKSSVSTLQALLPPLLQVQLISRQYLVDYILAHKAVVKFSYIVIRVFRNLLEHGFCRAQEEGGDDEDDQDSGEAGKEFDGTGMGQGEGKKDVSDQIEDEEQLLGLRDDPVTNETESVEKKPPEDTGLEMENDFEGTIQDAPDQENEEEDDQDEGEELDREMGDIDPEDANLVDNKLWGEDSDDDDEDIDPEKEKFDENARSDGAKTMEDEIRGKNEDQDTTDSKEDASEAQNQEPETKDEETEPFDEPNEDDAVNADWEDDYENEHGEFDESEPRDPDTEANKPDEELPEDMELDGGEPDRCEDEGQEECDVDSNDEQAAANEVEEEAEEPISPDEQDLTNEDMAKAAGSGDMDTQPEEDPAVIGGNGNSDSTIAEAAGQNGGQSSDKDETMMPDQATEKDKAEEDDPNQAEKPFQNAGDNDSGSNDQWSSNPISSSGEPQQPHSENLSKRESNAPNPYHDRELAREHWKRRVECIERENENDDIDPLRPQTTDFKHAELDADQESMEREGDQFALAPTNENDMQMDDVNSAQEETTNDNEENGSGTGGHAASNEQKTDVPHLDEDKPDDEAVIPNDTTAPMEWDTNEDEVNQDLTNRDSTRTDISQLEQNAEADRQESYNQSIDADLQNEETIPEDEIHSTEMEIQHLRDELDESISAWSQSDSMELSRGVELWCKYKAITLPSSQRLCEQLRLILEPMLRSKLEGDYRTGKRINMRKVIPYIASHFRKDKIWMRRTKPSKRAYQIMIAIDDSESMADNHAGRLALEAMTTLCRALSQLEVGQLSVVKFGHEFQLLHAFDVPFTDDAGGYVISQFGFQQKRTNMIQAIDTILHVLQAAKEQACNTSQSASAPDFTQIVFMISDGRFDTDGRLSVKKLIEKATEQNQLIVLLIVDDHPSSQAGSTAGNSILETKRVQFLNGNIQMIPYLEKYPFPYYVLLPSSQHLPEILSDSLRQWFELLSSRH